MNEWISVKDRLPEPHMPVLVSDKQKRVCIREYLWDNHWTRDKMDVARWMPLPLSPKHSES